MSVVPVTITQDNGEKRLIGHFDKEDKTLYVTRSRKKHFMKKLGAWGIDAKAYRGLMERGLTFVVLYDKDSGKRYITEARNFDEKGEYKHFKPHRAQIFLAERYWRLL